MRTRTSIWAGTAAFVTALGSMLVAGPTTAGASSPADQGVTAKTIAVGLPYVNFEALKSLGVTIDDGSFPDAYNGVIKMINAHGGVNGRKLVLSMAEMNPSVPAEATSSCTQLTEDDKVFVAIAPVFPDCYQADPQHAGDRRIAAGQRCRLRRRPTSPSSRPTRTSTRCSSPPSRRPVTSRARRSPSSTAPTRTPPR